MLLVYGAEAEEQPWRAKACVLHTGSPNDRDVATFRGKRINLLQGQTDLGYNPDPKTSQSRLWPND